jgi:hypothetical protein
MFMSVGQAARKWHISERRVRILCSEGRIDGVVRAGWAWNIPVDAPKPADGRRLRHLKNLELRSGVSDFSRLETLRSELAALDGKERQSFLLRYRDTVSRMIESALACEQVPASGEQISRLYAGSAVPELDQKTQLLALNFRSILLRAALGTGLGPLGGTVRIPQGRFSEQRLAGLYRMLVQGVADEDLGSYRNAALPPANPQPNDNRLFPVSLQMETMMSQYENEWSCFHPLVRAVFLFGELLRIRPFDSFGWVFATLVLGLELISGGYPPTMVGRTRLDEFKASMLLTRKRGNYGNVVRLLEQSLLYELHFLLHKETFDGL